MLGKLVVCIDDISKASKQISDSLKSRISEPTFTMKRLYEDRKSMKTYADLITTSNNRKPVFIECDDRRSELVEINPLLEGEGQTFWDTFYKKELDDPNVVGAFFEFFATYPLTYNIRRKEVRFDLRTLNAHKV